MNFIINKDWTFVPEWNKNQELENPIIISGKYLTPEKISKCVPITVNGNINIDRKAYIKESEIIIKNLEINGKPICTGEDLLKTPGLGGLFSELATYVYIENNRDPEKN